MSFPSFAQQGKLRPRGHHGSPRVREQVRAGQNRDRDQDSCPHSGSVTRTTLSLPEAAGCRVYSQLWSPKPRLAAGSPSPNTQLEFNKRAFHMQPTKCGGRSWNSSLTSCHWLETYSSSASFISGAPGDMLLQVELLKPPLCLG